MTRVEQIAEEARALGLRPWLAIKERLAAAAVAALAEAGDETVLQGGAALHFAYGSPRLSADVDVVGPEAARVLAERGPSIADAAGALLACPATWSMTRSGLLVRGKVTVALDAARRLVLPVEAYAVPAHTRRRIAGLGAVEEPEEIAADKIVASADRLARRGTLKTTDLYDLWYVSTQLGSAPPDRALIASKAADYRQPARGADLAAAALAVPPEELRATLEGVLPAASLAGIDERAIAVAAADLLRGYADVL